MNSGLIIFVGGLLVLFTSMALYGVMKAFAKAENPDERDYHANALAGYLGGFLFSLGILLISLGVKQ